MSNSLAARLRAIADLLEFVEGAGLTDQMAPIDDNETLECTQDAYNFCLESAQGREMIQILESIGVNFFVHEEIYCPDSDAMDANRTGNDVLADSDRSDSATDQPLTTKEQMVVDEFEKMRPGTGAIARQNILNQSSGWRKIIAEMSEEEIKVTESISRPNSFCYRHIH